jgi:hypothetical protein
MSDEEVARARSWMETHGGAVQVLVVSAEGMAPPQQTWFTTAAAAAALGNLRRLEVDQSDSLLMLAPVLGQLPHLQHLAAAVTTVADPHKAWQLAGGEEMVEGVFVNRSWRQWKPLPDLGRLCPQLTHLRLQMEVEVESYEYMGEYEGGITVDKRLPQLLPATLQHLTLSEGGDLGLHLLLHRNSLTHLATLQQLTLHCVELDSKGCRAVAKHLTALQQLRVKGPRFGEQHDPMVRLAPKLVEYSSRYGWAAATAPQLVHLTRLVWVGGMNEGAADALGALTGLQELVLKGCRDRHHVAAMLGQAAGLPQLRSLQMEGEPESLEDVSASLSRCTQLTSLILDVREGWGQPYLTAPQQLTGLRCLTVPWQMLQQEADAWLAPLTALTRLSFDTGFRNMLSSHEWPQHADARQQLGPLHQAKVQEVLQQVQVWPPAMQQVVVWVGKHLAAQGVAPRSWQYTPAAPGSAPFSVCFEEGDSSGSGQVAQGWVRPFSPCPHLPGVRELPSEVQGA